jgi:hypothetical protein
MTIYATTVAQWIIALLVFTFKYYSDQKHDREPFAAFLLLLIYDGVAFVVKIGAFCFCQLNVQHNKRLPRWLPALCIFFGLPICASGGLVAYFANEGRLLRYR